MTLFSAPFSPIHTPERNVFKAEDFRLKGSRALKPFSSAFLSVLEFIKGENTAKSMLFIPNLAVVCKFKEGV